MVPLTDPVPGQGFRLRPVVATLAGPVLLLLSFGVANRWVALVACLVVAAQVVALRTAPRLSALAVSVTVPLRAGVGEGVEHVVTVTNSAPKPSVPIVLRLRDDGFAQVHLPVPSIPAGATLELRVPRQAQERGRSLGPTVVAQGPDALGLLTHRRSARVPAPVLIHPAPTSAPTLPAPAAQAGAQDLAGVRPFRAGDRASMVHRRASARRPGSLVVAEREAEPVGRLVVVPDLRADDLDRVLGEVTAVVLDELAAHRPVAVVGPEGLVEGEGALDVLALIGVGPGVGVVPASHRGDRVVVAAGPGWRSAS